ncbi:MAG: efflux RND transporter periplasmic adaptor subunit [Candidatus Sumerlaeia bacterium]|nr:efflux RND transporter periplasmic adaptor subunit [Candidatus Sumerlaeia bacterium]
MAACGKDSSPSPAASPTSTTATATADDPLRREYAVPVAVRNILRATMHEYVATVGTVAPVRSLAVKAEESGRIHFVKPWREGDYVKENEILARLDEEETLREIEIAQADLDSARNDLALALAQVERTATDFARADEMFRHGQIARKAWEERKFSADSAKIRYEESVIRVQRAEKSLDRLLLQRDRKIVRAPMSGYLVASDALQNRNDASAANSAVRITDQEGRLVGTGTTICGVVDMEHVLIRCDVTSKDIGKIQKGQKAIATVYADEEVVVEGEVADVSQIMSMDTRAFKVDITAPNPRGMLRPGMFARVNIIIRTRRDTMIVERKIIQRRNNEDIVFVVNDEERAEKRTVQLGLENPDEVEILDGLREGDKLVVLGYETLQDKVKVKIMETEPAVAGKDVPTTATSTVKPPDGRA